MPSFIQSFIDAGRLPVPISPPNWDEKAIRIAGRINNKQRHLFKKFRIVPAAWYIWMREIGIVRKNFRIPMGELLLKIYLTYYDGIRTRQSKPGQRVNTFTAK